MRNTIFAFRAELLKLRHAKVFWVTVIAMMLMAIMGGFMMYVSMHPDLAHKSGLVGEKAQLMEEADWPAFFNLLAGMAAMGGTFLFGFVASWLFGREYSDKTVKDLLALPVSRSSIVAAKLLTATLWCLILVAAQVIAGFSTGWLAGLPGWSTESFSKGMSFILSSAALEMLLVAPVAFVASAGKGYLLPIGFVILTLVLANFAGSFGFGPYFPWAIPGIYSHGAGSAGLGAASYIILVATSVIGMVGTFAWWRYADQK